LLASTMENMKLFYEKTNAGRAPRRGDLSDLPVVDGHCHPLLTDPMPGHWFRPRSRISPSAQAPARLPHPGIARALGAGPDRAHGSAPASKLLHGSDIQALPEPLALAPDWARSALVGALAWLLERGELTFDESHEIAPAKSSRKMP